MKRAQRLETVDRLVRDKEQECALRAAGAQARLTDAESRAHELRRYLGEYRQAFEQRARSGMRVTGVRDYQAFITRIGEAVRQQETLVQQLTVECERARTQWRHAAVRKSGVGRLIARVRAEARVQEERAVQQEQDERAQRHGAMR
jgi:flagellar protein FliJ